MSLKAFRDRYPNAKVASEVVMMQGERFVVKVTVETPAAGSATGLAAHAQIEVAEDQARARALEGFGFSAISLRKPTPATTNAKVAAEDEPLPDDLAWEDEGTDTERPISEIEPADEPDQMTPSRNGTSSSATVSKPTASVPANRANKLPRTVVTRRQSPPDDNSQTVETDAQPSVEQSPQPAPATTAVEPIAQEALPDPINLSDVIAQTDIELRRLGWSVEAGREYLEKTYQKRSRHELSEEELIEFLCHLETLSDNALA